MTLDNNKRLTAACYTVNISMAIVGNLSPLLFLTFRSLYGISYSLLGLLVLINFVTQLSVDLAFSFFSHKFNIPKVVKFTPVLTIAGLLLYAAAPLLFPNAVYLGLVLGTIVFSAASGFAEVLISPVIAAIPSDNPQKDMSLLHSLYAFGVLTVVVVSTIFLRIFGTANWMYLTVFWALLPIIATVLFMLSPMPDMDVTAESDSKGTGRRTLALAICTGSIFFGSCAENAMSNWVSSYMENALHIDKAIGDLLGLALFAILLGLTRIAYAKFGKNISLV